MDDKMSFLKKTAFCIKMDLSCGRRVNQTRLNLRLSLQRWPQTFHVSIFEEVINFAELISACFKSAL